MPVPAGRRAAPPLRAGRHGQRGRLRRRRRPHALLLPLRLLLDARRGNPGDAAITFNIKKMFANGMTLSVLCAGLQHAGQGV